MYATVTLGQGSPSDLALMVACVAVFFLFVIVCSIGDAIRENAKRYGKHRGRV